MNYICIDGGGTKTKFVLYDENGQVIKEKSTGSIHILTQSKQESIRILKENVMLLDSSKKSLIIAGLAGYGNQEDLRKQIEDICQEAFEGYTYLLYNDVQIALAGALANQDGIVVIAGTGSIAYSCLNGQTKRCGGWGYQLGDEGSAYWMGKELMKIYCQQVDGRLEKTKLYDKVKESLLLENDYDIISYRHHLQNERKDIALLAKINYELALENDPYAIQIYKNAASYLGQLIKVLALDFHQAVPVSYIGGVFQAGEYILKPLKETLQTTSCYLQSPLYPPEYGAYLLGCMYTQKILKK